MCCVHIGGSSYTATRHFRKAEIAVHMSMYASKRGKIATKGPSKAPDMQEDASAEQMKAQPLSGPKSKLSGLFLRPKKGEKAVQELSTKLPRA